jgi:hypothetical protein
MGPHMNNARTIVLTAAFSLFCLSGTALGQDAHDHGGQPPNQPVEKIEPAPPPTPNPVPEGPHPRLIFSKSDHDFGRITDEGMTETQFRFKNEGTLPLKFTIPFRASCGCTAGNPRSDKNPDVDQVEFAPGESGFIKVSFNAHGKHGDVNQTVYVTSNDPVLPEQQVKIHAFVRQTIAFDPPLISFGEVMAGQPATQIVKVRGPAPDFKVTYATATRPRYLRAKVVETKEVDIAGEKMNESTIQLTFTGTAPRGALAATCTARTTSEKHPLADIQISAEVVGDVQVLPPRLNVGILEPGQPFSKVFRVSSRTGRTFKVVNVEQSTTMEALEVKVTAPEPGNESAYQIEVKGKSPAQASAIMATLTVVTDVPGDERIQVQLNGATRAPAPPPQPTGDLTPPPMLVKPPQQPSPMIPPPPQ